MLKNIFMMVCWYFSNFVVVDIDYVWMDIWKGNQNNKWETASKNKKVESNKPSSHWNRVSIAINSTWKSVIEKQYKRIEQDRENAY